MAEQTLLTMTQNILSRMSSDQVNSISDTVESLQVANIIQNKYYDILSRGGLPEDDQLLQFTPSNDLTQPVLMFLPAGCSKVTWLKYFDTNPQDGASLQSDQFGSYDHDVNVDIPNSTSFWTTTSTSSVTMALGHVTWTVASSSLPVIVGQNAIANAGPNVLMGTIVSYVGTTLVMNVTSMIGSGTFSAWVISTSGGNAPPGYQYVTILPIQQFFDIVNNFNPSEDDVFSYTFQQGSTSYNLYYMNNHQPSYCTVLSNYYVLFDSYDNTQDTTLQASKVMAYGQVVPPFQLVDTFIPDLDDNQFPLLLNEATALAFYELKQQPHALAAQEIKRQWSTVQKNKSVSNKPGYFDQLANFGRTPNTGGYGGRALPRLRTYQ